MALNYSQRPVFPTHLPEDNLVSPMRIANGCFVEDGGEGYANGEGYFRSWYSNLQRKDLLDYGRERVGSSAHESGSSDIIDLLPLDPFGMDMDIRSTVTALTGWFENMDVDNRRYRCDEANRNHHLNAELNHMRNNNMMKFHQNLVGDSVCSSSYSGCAGEKEEGGGFAQGALYSVPCSVDDMSSLGSERTDPVDESSMLVEVTGGGPTHEAMSCIIAYLDMPSLWSLERVSKSLYSMVQDESSLWIKIYIDESWKEQITDDILLKITNRAQGRLECLTLIGCTKITDHGLERVLKKNPKLKQLSLPACRKLTIEGILNSLRASKNLGSEGVKHLRICGLNDVTETHLKELKALLGTDDQLGIEKPVFYRGRNCYLPCEDNRAIDVEICPKCQFVRLVYDCPEEDCQGKKHTTVSCRGCIFCVMRCHTCGTCLDNKSYMETFFLDLRCLVCSKSFPDPVREIDEAEMLTRLDINDS